MAELFCTRAVANATGVGRGCRGEVAATPESRARERIRHVRGRETVRGGKVPRWWARAQTRVGFTQPTGGQAPPVSL